jgi:alpha-galactosidase/6-phospho-beta-glucosidase family protein
MLVVLGGSSPWTIPLLRILEADAITLVGRDLEALEATRRFMRSRTGTTLHVSTSPTEALAQATLVLCQARIGGAAGRAADERGAQEWQAWGDETLGIGGLRTALRARSTLAAWAAAAPGTPVLMFTNPTDLLTRWWASHSGGTAVSLCEVPTMLLRGLPTGSRYLGINHLGFAVTPDGRSVPTRWLGLLDDLSGEVAKQRSRPVQRAEVVADLATRLRQAIAREDESEVDALLSVREPIWYERLIVPIVESLNGGRPFRGVTGLANGTRLPEVGADVIVESIGTATTPDALAIEKSAVPRVTEFAIARERAWDCMVDLNEQSLRRYLAADPFTAGLDYSPGLLGWLGGAEGSATPAR